MLTAVTSGTYYATGLGACGIYNVDTDYIAAASHILYDSFPGYAGGNPNANPICGRKATAHCKSCLRSLLRWALCLHLLSSDQGKSVTVAITDRCEACAEWDLDFSPSAFSQLADESLGRLSGMKWYFH